ncbi:MAG: hypothetical protein PWQ97_134 [Tepidanaerobacteraceae bacterium]|nr:hypothetical protein [Tepidanaerobacteraceae bacterium]
MFGDMEKMAKIFQDEILRLKEQLKNTVFTEKSCDNRVTVSINGLEEVVKVSFNADELHPEIKNYLESSTLEATNRALLKVKEYLKQKFSNYDLFGGI